MAIQTRLVSDAHLGHTKTALSRGFASVDDHDATLLTNYRRIVQPWDITWWLGDLSVFSSRRRIEILLGLIDSLPGEKHLIAGNHDPVHPMHRDSHKWQALYLQVFSSVQAFARRNVVLGPPSAPVKTPVLLSHFPYTADHDRADGTAAEPRHMEYRLRDEGYWLWHGHTHSKQVRTSAREIHVGLDAWDMTPVSVDQLTTEMNRPYAAEGSNAGHTPVPSS